MKKSQDKRGEREGLDLCRLGESSPPRGFKLWNIEELSMAQAYPKITGTRCVYADKLEKPGGRWGGYLPKGGIIKRLGEGVSRCVNRAGKERKSPKRVLRQLEPLRCVNKKKADKTEMEREPLRCER